MKLWVPFLAIIALSLFTPTAAFANAPPIAAFTSCAWGSADCNVCVADPVGSIQRLRSHGDAMGFHMDGAPDVDLLHHWQGVQRLMGGGGRYFAISRSLEDESTDVSFVVVEMATRNTDGLRFRSNRLESSWSIPLTAPPVRDRVVRTMPHEAGFKHAGGLQSLGNVLAVPFESGPGSKVVFYELTNPVQPVRLANEVDHTPLSGEAGSATLAKLADGRFLLIIGRADAATLDFYVSTGTDLRTTGFTWFDTWYEHELTGGDSKFGDYQQLSFVAGCNGTLFLVGTHRASIITSNDFIDLFTVSNGPGDDVVIHKVANKHLTCNGNCDFDAAGGVYVDPRGRLYVYGTTHDNDGVPYDGYGSLPGPLPPIGCAGPGCSTELAEFRPVPHATCETIEDAWVELYRDIDFGGRSLIIDFADRALEDYANLDHAEDFGDEASSVRWCLPHGAAVRLWQNAGPCDGGHRDLVGDGTFHNINDLSSLSFGDTTSCVEWIGGPFARSGADRTLECRGPTTPARLDDRASISLVGGPLALLWEAAGVTFDDATSATPLGGFPLAQTDVSLTLTDPVGSDADSVTVTIVDTIAPTIACPANVVVDATTPGGAAVSYPAPTAVDGCSIRSVMCTAQSGSLFPIGTNSVQCTATDNANHAASCSFTVKVKSPAEQAADLIVKIKGLPGVDDGLENSFVVKLRAVVAAIALGNTTSACGELQALASAVQAHAGKQLTAVQAAALLADITRIRAALGCV